MRRSPPRHGPGPPREPARDGRPLRVRPRRQEARVLDRHPRPADRGRRRLAARGGRPGGRHRLGVVEQLGDADPVPLRRPLGPRVRLGRGAVGRLTVRRPRRRPGGRPRRDAGAVRRVPREALDGADPTRRGRPRPVRERRVLLARGAGARAQRRGLGGRRRGRRAPPDTAGHRAHRLRRRPRGTRLAVDRAAVPLRGGVLRHRHPARDADGDRGRRGEGEPDLRDDPDDRDGGRPHPRQGRRDAARRARAGRRRPGPGTRRRPGRAAVRGVAARWSERRPVADGRGRAPARGRRPAGVRALRRGGCGGAVDQGRLDAAVCGDLRADHPAVRRVLRDDDAVVAGGRVLHVLPDLHPDHRDGAERRGHPQRGGVRGVHRRGLRDRGGAALVRRVPVPALRRAVRLEGHPAADRRLAPRTARDALTAGGLIRPGRGRPGRGRPGRGSVRCWRARSRGPTPRAPARATPGAACGRRGRTRPVRRCTAGRASAPAAPRGRRAAASRPGASGCRCARHRMRRPARAPR
ncbi:hypothetical protein Cus16_3018 [Curtobacterium sp. ER1/6]|nr:hypothetical protein Cus16_3018 [Curtobacterium sp. ER1/6]